jgi:cobalt-precorrin-5B (C1)-methyltransferase
VDPVCVVEVGDFTGIALRRAAAAGIRRAVLVAMAGKITKLAAGVMMTHFHRSKVDNELMARVARQTSAPPPVVDAATATATARHFFEACRAAGFTSPLEALCHEARAACEAHVDQRLTLEVWMVDFDGADVVARG